MPACPSQRLFDDSTSHRYFPSDFFGRRLATKHQCSEPRLRLRTRLETVTVCEFSNNLIQDITKETFAQLAREVGVPVKVRRAGPPWW